MRLSPKGDRIFEYPIANESKTYLKLSLYYESYNEGELIMGAGDRLNLQHMVGKKRTLRRNLYILKMVWEISPARVLLTMLQSLLDFGFWVFGTVVFMQFLFGAVEFGRSFSEVVIFLSIFMLASMLGRAFDSWFTHRYCIINDQLLYRHLNKKLFDKASNVDIACYENTEFYNSYTKAAAEIFQRGVSVVRNLSQVFSAALASIFVLYTMFQINAWVGLFGLAPTIANMTLGRLAGKAYYERDMENVPHRRRQDYVNRVIYLQRYAKEIRLTGIFSVLGRTYNDAMGGIIKVSEKYWKKLAAYNSLKSTICFPLFFEGIWLFAAFLAMVQKSIEITDFVVLVNAAVSGTWMVISFVDALNETYKNALYADNLITFINYKPKIPEDAGGIPVPETIDHVELRNVCFHYEGSEKNALTNISFTLRRGELISLVGHNGSGKSTLVKLIMRLYDPTEGQILMNGVDIREYAVRDYRSLIGSTFQDFQIFSTSIQNNVIMGNRIAKGDPEQIARASLEKSGIIEKIDSIPGGMQATLTREFDDAGVNLSGGEAQKVAIARSFAKQCPILLLDEPSSALDPIAEYQMYKNYIALCKESTDNGGGKISLFITHRLSTAVLSDRIVHLEHGEITEVGTHAELMLANASYAEVFRKQAENYLMEVSP